MRTDDSTEPRDETNGTRCAEQPDDTFSTDVPSGERSDGPPLVPASRCVTSADIAAAWASVQPTAGDIRHALTRLHGKALAIFALVVTSYWVLVITDAALPVRMVAAASLAAGLAAVGTNIMHDANHGS